MTIQQALKEWRSKRRRMGCVSATDWFCRRVPGFYPRRLKRYDTDLGSWEHVVAEGRGIRIDLAPWADQPSPAQEQGGGR